MHDTNFTAMDTAHGKWNFGLVFNQTAVETRIGKCAYMYDAHTASRVNRGCGCASKYDRNCGQDAAPYKNQECEYADWDKAEWTPIPGTCKNNTDLSPLVERCWCNSQDRHPSTPLPKDAITTSQQCYFKLPAMYPPKGNFSSELRDMMQARIANQADASEILEDGRVRWRQEYWNELVIDAEMLREMYEEGNPGNAVAALIYIRGMGGKPFAREVQKLLKHTYGGQKIPIIQMDTKVDASCSGPFRIDDLESDETTVVV